MNITKPFVLACFFFASLTTLYAQQHRVVGYLPNTLDVAIDFGKVTHLNLAFENPDANGNLSFSPLNDRYIQQAHAQGKKVLVSIGGGPASEDAQLRARYFELTGDARRKDFVMKICAYLVDHKLDGLDVDLEGQSINADYGKFIQALFETLKPKGLLLTAALTHANGGDRVPASAIPLFDFINIMAYDDTGPWNPGRPGQHSSFDYAVSSLNYWVGRGLPKSKAVLGVPFYGYGFGKDFNWGMSYAQIVSTYADAHKQDVAGSHIYYNGADTMQKKVQYVVSGEYGGIMIWQLAQDAEGERSLLLVIDRVLHAKP
jgi:chitinase